MLFRTHHSLLHQYLGLFFWFVGLFFETGSHIAPASLKLAEDVPELWIPLPQASHVLGLQVCATSAGFIQYFLSTYHALGFELL